jgi:hypothetical protein
MAQNRVAGIGQLSFLSTSEKKCANGVALSRASVHQMRALVRRTPITQIIREQNIIKRRPNVAPWLLVACEYTAARGKEPLLLSTSSRFETPYIIAMA